jgi:cell division ATPase FtsA
MEEAESIKRNLKPSDSKKLFQIIEARMEDFVDLVKRDLERSHSGAQIANGIILTGGSANLYEIQEKMRYKLKIPVTDGKSIINKQSHSVLKDASWINAFALTFIDFRQDSLMQSLTKITVKTIKRFFQKITP